MSRKRRTSVQETIEPKEKRKKKSKKITAVKIGEKIGKGIAAIKKADIAIQKWADSPEVIPSKTIKKLKKGKGVVGRTYRGYKRVQKAEEEYAERLEEGTKAHAERLEKKTKAHKKRLKQMDSLVNML